MTAPTYQAHRATNQPGKALGQETSCSGHCGSVEAPLTPRIARQVIACKGASLLVVGDALRLLRAKMSE